MPTCRIGGQRYYKYSKTLLTYRVKKALAMSSSLPTFYIPHGGGPCFDMDWPQSHQRDVDALATWLSDLSSYIAVKPRAILMITAHWMTTEFTVSTNPQPAMLYDYGGFPPYTYQLRYDAPGSPELAAEIVSLLQLAEIPIHTDDSRGFDHGTFVPLRKVYPAADTPVVQLSIKRNYNPAEHIALGHALKPLREKGVLILGSGMSFHNMGGFMNTRFAQDSLLFHQWLTESIEAQPIVRNERLLQWAEAPSARHVHPEEDHLIPLMVIAGAAGDDVGKKVFEGNFLGPIINAYQFG